MDTTWLTAAQAAEHATRARRLLSAGAAAIKPDAIYQWVRRGHLQPAGLADDGRTRLYRLGDVAQAEKATRARALRLVGIPEQPSAGSGPALVTDRTHRCATSSARP